MNHEEAVGVDCGPVFGDDVFTSEGSGAGQNETGVKDPRTDPMNAHIMLLGSYADSYGGAYVEDGKHYLLVTCDPQMIMMEYMQRKPEAF